MRLHFFSTKALVGELAQARVSTEQQAYYVIANVRFNAVLAYTGLIVASSPPLSLPALLELCVVIAISAFGIFRSYEASGGKSSQAFLTEFTCLFVPVGITTYLPIWLAYWAIRVSFTPALISLSESHAQFAVNLSRMGTDFFGLLAFVAAVAGVSVGYWRVTKLMQDVQRLKHGG